MLERNIRENKYKRYVGVILCYPEGLDRSRAQIIRIQFRDGSVWVVSKTFKGYWAAAQKAGGRGMLYPILASPRPPEESAEPIQEHMLHLFNDDDEWFVELDEPEMED